MTNSSTKSIGHRNSAKISDSEIIVDLNKTGLILALTVGTIFGFVFTKIIFKESLSFFYSNFSKMNFIKLVNNTKDIGPITIMSLVTGLFLFALIKYLVKDKSEFIVLKINKDGICFKKNDNSNLNFDCANWKIVDKISLIKRFKTDSKGTLTPEYKKVIIFCKNGTMKETNYSGMTEEKLYTFLKSILPENIKVEQIETAKGIKNIVQQNIYKT